MTIITRTFGDHVQRKKANDASIAPNMATFLHPNIETNTLAIGPIEQRIAFLAHKIHNTLYTDSLMEMV